MGQPKRLALLSYLALQPKGSFTRRDHLLTVFWPDVDQERARGSLRQALRFLRVGLNAEAIVSRGSEEIAVRPGSVATDAAHFADLIARGQMAAALDVYRGGFMDGFHVRASNQFDDWVETRHQALQTDATTAAWALSEEAESNGHGEEAAYWGKRALGLVPLSERGVQRLIRLLDRVGDRAGALRAYRGLESRLDRDFKSQPSPETRQLIEQVKSRAYVHQVISPPSGRRLAIRRATADRRLNVQKSISGPERRGVDPRRSGDDRRTSRDRREPL